MTEQRPIINTHDQLHAAGGGVAIVVSYGGTRERYVDGWLIYKIGLGGSSIATDEKAAWYHHQMKWFSVGVGAIGDRSKKRAALIDALSKAQRWVAEQYGEHGPWKRNAQGDFVPDRIQKAFPIKRRKP